MMVDLGEAQVLEGQRPKTLGGLGRRDRAVPDGVE